MTSNDSERPRAELAEPAQAAGTAANTLTAPAAGTEAPAPHSHTPPRYLPYGRWWAMLFGALAGLLIRLAFMGKSSAYAPMMAACIFGAPVVCAAVTVIMAESQARRSWSYYFFAPMGACALMVLGALLVLIEGLICAIVIVPLFALVSGVTGLLVGAICRFTQRRRETLACVLAVPLILGGVEQHLPLPNGYASSTQSVWIRAQPETVWPLLLNIAAIAPSDSDDSLAWRIGVPRPMGAYTVQQDGKLVRKSQWHKHIAFDEVITEAVSPKRLAWQYDFKPGDVPPGALDDHVAIGGRYFDLLDSRYELTPERGGTRLSLRTRWRVSTRFNWYAQPLSQLLINDLSRQLLTIYKTRSEAGPTAVVAQD